MFSWINRTLAILFILFVSLFALDVFGMGTGFWETLVGLLIHLIPSFLLIVALAVAWRHEIIGGLIFLFFGAAYTVLVWDNIIFGLPIAVPLFLIGILFLIQGWMKKSALSVDKK